jgi:hypothetical protein
MKRMSKNNWALSCVAVLVLLVGLLYTGTLQSWLGSDDNSAATAATTVKATSVATAIQSIIGGINAASLKNNVASMDRLQTEYASTLNSISLLIPQLKNSIDTLVNKGKDMSVAQAAFIDMSTKFSFLQSHTLSLQNAKIDVANLTAVYDDLSAIRTALQKK